MILDQEGGNYEFVYRDLRSLLVLVPHGKQSEVKCRAPAAIGIGPDPPSVRFDDRLTDRQAHAAALQFGCEERIRITHICSTACAARNLISRRL